MTGRDAALASTLLDRCANVQQINVI